MEKLTICHGIDACYRMFLNGCFLGLRYYNLRYCVLSSEADKALSSLQSQPEIENNLVELVKLQENPKETALISAVLKKALLDAYEKNQSTCMDEMVQRYPIEACFDVLCKARSEGLRLYRAQKTQEEARRAAKNWHW